MAARRELREGLNKSDLPLVGPINGDYGWAGMDEFREVLTEAEERFERYKRLVGFVVGPVVLIVLYLLPMELSAQAHGLTAVTGFVLVFWLTEAVPVPVTALLGAVLNVLLGVAPAPEVFAPFAHPLVFLFLGGFLLALGMQRWRLHRRIALAILLVLAICWAVGWWL